MSDGPSAAQFAQMTQRMQALERRVTELETMPPLVEELVLQIRQSCYVELARVEAYLDAVVLAAEQVQDKRIEQLETPKEVTGWEFFGNVLLTFFLESTLPGKLLAGASKAIFTRILRQNAVFRLLPRSPYGDELLKDAQRLARLRRQTVGPAKIIPGTGGVPSRIVIAEPTPGFERKQISEILKMGARGPGLDALGRENVALYHWSLEALIRGSDRTQQNLTAAAHATREAIQRERPRAGPNLEASDSAGVAIVGAAQQYAALTRLGIQATHARFEQMVRGGEFLPEDLPLVAKSFDWDPFEFEIDGQRISGNLAEIRARYRGVVEAFIWANLYGFDAERATPKFFVNQAAFDGVPKAFPAYWVRRFATNVDDWNATRPAYSGVVMKAGFKGRFADLHYQNQVGYVGEYFWAIRKALPMPAKGELTEKGSP